MTNLHFISTKALIAMYMQQMVLQQQLIEAQQKVIELQQRIDALTPPNPPDKEIFWHIAAKGQLSVEAAQSDDIQTVRRFQDWNIKFAKKHVKPYVNPSVYQECLNQMTRGLPERIAELETRSETSRLGLGKRPSKQPILQLPLLKEGV